MSLQQRLRTRSAYFLALAIGSLALIFAPLGWLSSEKFTAYAAAVQALGILLAIIIAVTTLQSDSRDRRVDRTLALHQELTIGNVGDARRRLGLHLRKHGDSGHPVKHTLMSDLRDDRSLSKYSPPLSGCDPFTDVELVVRYFERCRMVQIRGSVDEPLFVELIGRQAAWWDKALLPDHTNARLALSELSSWASEYAESNNARFPHLANWGNTRKYDFPAESADVTRDRSLGGIF